MKSHIRNTFLAGTAALSISTNTEAATLHLSNDTPLWNITQETPQIVDSILGNSEFQEILNIPVSPKIQIERLITQASNNEEIDTLTLESLLSPEKVGWEERTIHGQILADSLDQNMRDQLIQLPLTTQILEIALSYGNQGTDAENCSTVENQIRRSSGMFAQDLGIGNLLHGAGAQNLAEHMCNSTLSGTLESVVEKLGYEITDDTVIYNLFGSGKNPEGTDGGVGMTYRIAKGLQVTNAYVTDTGELVANFVACGGNFAIITQNPEIIEAFQTYYPEPVVSSPSPLLSELFPVGGNPGFGTPPSGFPSVPVNPPDIPPPSPVGLEDISALHLLFASLLTFPLISRMRKKQKI